MTPTTATQPGTTSTTKVGHPYDLDPATLATIHGRIWTRVKVVGTCWEWQGSLSEGYGQIKAAVLSDYPLRLHRLMWWLMHGVWSGDGWEVDHKCRNRRCLRPAHLELVPKAKNIERGRAPLLTHCKRSGHEYTPENTYVRPDGWRECRSCIAERRILRGGSLTLAE